MFDSKVLAKLAQDYQKAFEKLNQIEKALSRDCLNSNKALNNGRFVGMERPIRALILSVASGEPLLLIGPTGTGKSRLIRAFCGLLGLLDLNDPSKDHRDYFEYLLTPFTEPSELFGRINISKAIQGKLERIEDGMLQQAKMVYLDEIFNGSSAILNSILAILNERIFHDLGVRKKVAMQCLFAATNQVPETPELRAIFDRFVLRCRVDNVVADSQSVGKLLEAGWLETFGRHKRGAGLTQLLRQMEAFRKAVVELTAKEKLVPQPDHPFHKHLAHLVQHARQYDLSEMSNRRLVKMTHIMLIHRVYEAVRQEQITEDISLGTDELELLPHYFLDRVDEEVVDKMERIAARWQ
jgi:MoxR-like ATPase